MTAVGSDGGTTATSAATEGGSSGDGTQTGGPAALDCDRDHAPTLGGETVAAEDTDPAITPGFDHVIVRPPAPVGKLFVFFPGTSGPPAAYRQILQNAAAGGYDALGLAYRNELAVNDLCTLAQPDCHENVRIEVITGQDTSPLVEVSREDSIEFRLVRVLQHLGWDQYLDGESLRWDLMALSGHSQGGGHAGYLAREHEVHRAALFAATEPATWTEQPTATAPDRLFGFMHTEEPNFTAIGNSWENLGLPGELTDIDEAEIPFAGSHRLTTSVPAPENPHGAVVTDLYTPLEGDLPLYRDVWCVLIGP